MAGPAIPESLRRDDGLFRHDQGKAAKTAAGAVYAACRVPASRPALCPRHDSLQQGMATRMDARSNNHWLGGCRSLRTAGLSADARCAGPGGAGQLRNSGEIRLGRNSETFGHIMIRASTISIGMSMIIVSLIAERMLMPATEQAIIRHRP